MADWEVGMRGDKLAPDATDQVASPVAFAHGSCFPYGGVKRIRFEDFRGRACPNLSPELRARLNEVGIPRMRIGWFFNLKRRIARDLPTQISRAFRWFTLSSHSAARWAR